MLIQTQKIDYTKINLLCRIFAIYTTQVITKKQTKKILSKVALLAHTKYYWKNCLFCPLSKRFQISLLDGHCIFLVPRHVPFWVDLKIVIGLPGSYVEHGRVVRDVEVGTLHW